MITLNDLLTSGGAHTEIPERSPPTEQMLKDGASLVERVNALLAAFGRSRSVNSGYRDAQHNKQVNGGPNSTHLFCRAVDLRDIDEKLDAWCLSNTVILKRLGLYLEHPLDTLNWCHLQIVPPRSGRTVFRK